jgi:phosphopantothenoylcysteine decarboxylase/phosphopantothenate--cysteine ligase
MRILITAGPTRQPIDDVRFITNRSSGKMGAAIASVFCAAGWDVTVLLGPVDSEVLSSLDDGVTVLRFETIDQLQSLLDAEFSSCDVLVMSAAVGDFQPTTMTGKLSRSAGAFDLHLEPTSDVLASVAASKRDDQFIVSFAVESGDRDGIEAKARQELASKNADIVLLNTPAAMGATESDACVLSADEVLVPWGRRSKLELAQSLVPIISARFESN